MKKGCGAWKKVNGLKNTVAYGNGHEEGLRYGLMDRAP